MKLFLNRTLNKISIYRLHPSKTANHADMESSKLCPATKQVFYIGPIIGSL